MDGTSRRLVLALMAASPLLGAADAPSARMEIAYGDDPEQRLDLYPQAGLSGAPMLLYVHGGVWTLFDKSGVDALPDFARRHGVLFASTNFRRASAENAAIDVASAIDWMLREGPKYGGDPRRLYILGHSSAGNTVALVAVDPRFLAKHGRTAADIAGVIGLDGAGYNAASQIHDLFVVMRPPVLAMWAAALGTRAAELSPTRLVAKDGRYPPFLLVYTDHPGGRKYTVELAEKLKGASGLAEVIEARDKSHFSVNSDLGRAGDPVGERLAAFIATGKP